ncbi:MAG TPA: SGNH/GDSL hydrolase family protein, partial [Acidobacteriota bacterium]
MKTRAKILSMLLFVACAATTGLSAQEHAALLEQFEFQGQTYSIYDRSAPAAPGLTLKGRTSMDLSAGMAGENILLGTRIRGGNFYIFWLNYRQKAVRLAFYDQRRGRSRLLPLTGFSFIGLPEIIEENDGLQGLVFLGNKTNNDDIFYYEPKKGLLTALTETPFSEKGFTLLEKDGCLEIETRSLWAHYRYRFDPRLRETTLVEEQRYATGQKQSIPEFTPEYYNTYIGFGDSITWGEIEGVQRLDLCYLTQMQALLADPGYENFYGASYFVNLGVPGDSTLAGADRVDKDLNGHAGLYFLLMLGVNDVIQIDFSIESSLENLGYIIDAAKSRGMRAIVSTLTPSKAGFSQHQFY